VYWCETWISNGYGCVWTTFFGEVLELRKRDKPNVKKGKVVPVLFN